MQVVNVEFVYIWLFVSHVGASLCKNGHVPQERPEWTTVGGQQLQLPAASWVATEPSAAEELPMPRGLSWAGSQQ